jgi:hypothetical protein
MRIIYTSKECRKVWGARYTLGARYLSKKIRYIAMYGAKTQNPLNKA